MCIDEYTSICIQIEGKKVIYGNIYIDWTLKAPSWENERVQIKGKQAF